jgi:hypothetical protein
MLFWATMGRGIDMSKRQTLVFWGLIFMVSYLYAYQISFVSQWHLTPTALEHSVEPRNISDRLFWSLNRVYGVLWNLSFPTVAVSQRFFPEDYYTELVYIPLINAFQWFGYGCLFGLWRYRRKTRLASP